MILIGFVILSFFYFALAESEKNNEECFEDFSKLEPSFSLVVRSKTPVIDKGDPLEFEIYITGYGTIVNSTKIYFSIPIDLVDSNITYGFVNYFSGFENIENGGITTLDNLKFNKKPLDYEGGFTIGIPPDFYGQIMDLKTVDDCYNLQILTETKVKFPNESGAPILVRINTSENAPEGDNKIDIFLTYSDGKKVYQDKNEVEFHINSWSEEHKFLYSLIIITIGALILAVVSLIWNYIAIRVKSHFKTNESIKTEKSNNQ